MNLIQIYAICATFCMGLCSAQPIPSLGTSDQNRFILGALIFLSFGAVLTGCVCCRRRKKGFEEFSNDSGNLEGNKNEYPIFRALSPDNQRSISNEGVNEVFEYNDSHENLIVNEADNNNGPISPADLQNIENNNATHFIENRNNIDVEVESAQAVNDDIEPKIDVTPSSSHLDVETISSSNDQLFENDTISLKSQSKQDLVIFNEKEISDMYKNFEKNNLLNFVPIQTQNAKKCIESEKEELIESVNEIACINPTETSNKCSTIHNYQQGSEDLNSKIQISDKTHEEKYEEEDVCSIEEALRVLDNAIENEEYLNDYCADEYDEKYQIPHDNNSTDSEDYHTIIRDLLSNEVMKAKPNLMQDYSNTNEKYMLENISDIRNQLVDFVDDILNESLAVVEKEKYNKTSHSCTVNDKDKEEGLQTEKFICISRTPKKTNGLELFEDFFTDEILAKTSTPFVNSKIQSTPYPTIIPQKLFDESSSNALHNKSINDINEDFQGEINGTWNCVGINNATFDAVTNKTLDAQNNYNDFIYPGDPCTSKQAIERDQIIEIKYHIDENVKSEDLNTITPVNTPIELNYNQETWAKMTKGNEDDSKNGWFLHPQMFVNENTDVVDDDEAEKNLELTFESLRKQLAEVLPHPQGMAGPPEYSDDEIDAETNRTFDEYRSPLDGLYGLLEIDSTPLPKDEQIEMFINYKRQLSPIMEESEDESCRTFAVNETKCLDSTSTGCVGTVEAILGVTKVLMASNDTLFNFEDTLGDTEDALSSLLSSHNNSEATTPVKGNRALLKNVHVPFIASDVTQSNDLLAVTHSEPKMQIYYDEIIQSNCKKLPPTTIDFAEHNLIENDFNSPDQQKTYSEGTANSSTADRQSSSDICPTLDNEATNDDKTCVTIIIKDDDHSSNNTYSNLIESVSKEYSSDFIEDYQLLSLPKDDTIVIDKVISSSDIIANSVADSDGENDDTCHSVQTDGISHTSQYITAPESECNENQSSMKSEIATLNPSYLNSCALPNKDLIKKGNYIELKRNKIEYESTKNMIKEKVNEMLDTLTPFINNAVAFKTSQINVENTKENIDPNNSDRFVSKQTNSNDKEMHFEKVINNSHDGMFTDKPQIIKNVPILNNDGIVHDCIENGSTINTIHDNCAFVEASNYYDLTEPSENELMNDCLKSINDNYQSSLRNNDNDNDDSHSSSEEFMYIRGSRSPPSPEQINSNDTCENLQINSWSQHNDGEIQIQIENVSEVNNDYVPSLNPYNIDDNSSKISSNLTKNKCNNDELVKGLLNSSNISASATDFNDADKTENKRPDSGVGETGDMCSSKLILGRSMETILTSNSPDELDSQAYIIELDSEKEQHLLTDSINLRPPFSTGSGSVDSLSSSSSNSDKQLNISKLNENNFSIKTESYNFSDNYLKLNEKDINTKSIKNLSDYQKTEMVIIPSNESIGENVKHGDSTDEDSGIESIMKINK